jgi:imidazole glycerol-phosphate synthase subunit HisF
VIASGGAGELEHLSSAIGVGADAVLCASILHYGRHTVSEIKEYLSRAGVPVRAPG